MSRATLAVLALLASLAAGRALPGEEGAPPAAAFRWEGLARRNPGLVLKSRWDAGVLELKDDLLRWSDRKDSGKNLVLPVRRLASHELVCPKGAAAPCTEWRLLTKTETYVFQEAPDAGGAVVRRVFDAFRAAYAGLPSSETR